MLGYYYRRLDSLEIGILILGFILFISSCYEFNSSLILVYILGFGLCYTPVNTEISERFTNLLFTTLWLILVILFLAFHENTIGYSALFLFLYSHLCRTTFWLMYKVEPIPFGFGKYGIISRENDAGVRLGESRDKWFSGIRLFSSIFLVILLAFLLR